MSKTIRRTTLLVMVLTLLCSNSVFAYNGMDLAETCEGTEALEQFELSDQPEETEKSEELEELKELVVPEENEIVDNDGEMTDASDDKYGSDVNISSEKDGSDMIGLNGYIGETVNDIYPDQSSFTDPIKLQINYSVQDNLEDKKSANYYMFTLDKPGYINIFFSHDYIDEKNRDTWTIHVYNNNNTEMPIMSYNINRKMLDTETDPLGLPAGTYYIKIMPYSSINFSDTTYLLFVEFKESDSYETELNNGTDTADEISVNKEYAGNINKYGDCDYYSFYLPQPGYVSFMFSHEYVDSDEKGKKLNADKYFWGLYLYGEDDIQNELLSHCYKGNITKINSYGTGLPAGYYHIKIRGQIYLSNYWNPTTYHFTVNYTPSSYYECERNNNPGDASEVEFDTTYNGNICRTTGGYLEYYNDDDYYEFTMDNPGNISITFSHETLDAKDPYWDVLLYGSGDFNNSLWQNSYAANVPTAQTSEKISLAKGKFYIQVKAHKPKANQKNSDVLYHIRINKVISIDISKAVISGIKSKTYSGKAVTQDPKVVLNGNTLRKGTDYSISYNNNIDAGTAIMTIEGRGDYQGTIVRTFKIKKTAIKISAKTVKLIASELKKKGKTIKVNKAFDITKNTGKTTFTKKSGNKKITISKSGKVTVKKGLKKGSYTVKVKVKAAGNKNYKAATKTVTFKIVVD